MRQNGSKRSKFYAFRLTFYMFLPPKKKKKTQNLESPLYNVVGRRFTEEFWPPVSSHVSVSPLFFACSNLLYLFRKLPPFHCPDTNQNRSLASSRPPLRPTSPLVFGPQEISHVKLTEFWFGSSRIGETKQIACRSKWMDLVVRVDSRRDPIVIIASVLQFTPSAEMSSEKQSSCTQRSTFGYGWISYTFG